MDFDDISVACVVEYAVVHRKVKKVVTYDFKYETRTNFVPQYQGHTIGRCARCPKRRGSQADAEHMVASSARICAKFLFE